MRFFLVILLSFLLLGTASAQLQEAAQTAVEMPQAVWAEKGLEINNTPGNTTQQNPKIISTEYGYYIVWEDGRSGQEKLYAQKTDESGNRLWNENGVQVSTASGNQNSAQVIEDGAGGIIIVWQDYRHENADIYAQRLSPQGEVLWGGEGAPVSKAAAGQFAPEIVSDGAGGAIAVWHDYRSNVGEDIYAQRLNGSGAPLWQEDGIPVCTAPGTQWYPKIASDRAGGAIIVWTDGRVSSADNNIFAQRVSADGKILWEKDGVSVCSAPQNQERPEMIAVDGGAIVAWNDSRSGNIDIYTQKISPDGQPLWDKDGIAVVAIEFSQENPKLAPDGLGGALLVWTDDREEETAIYFQKITKEGRRSWIDSGVLVAKSSAKQENPVAVKLSNEGWIIFWEGYHNGSPGLFAQKINRDGIPLWQERGIPVADVTGAQEKISVAVTPKSEIISAWQDRRNGNYDLYAQKLTSDGILTWGKDGRPICNAIGAVIHQNVAMIDNGLGELILVFEDARSGYLNIYAQKINRAGNLAWGRDGIAVAKVRANQTNPQLASDGAGGTLVTWEDARDPNFQKIYAQRISAAGKKVWEKGSLPLTKNNSRQSSPRLISAGDGGAIVVWLDERNPLNLKDLYGQKVSGKGELLWNKNGVAISADNGDQTEEEIISDGSNGAIITWTDFRNGERNPDIYAQSIDGDGEILWKKEGIVICGAPDIQRTPQLAGEEEGGAIIAWTDKGGGSYDIYAQRVNRQGQTLWSTDGIPLCQIARTQQEPLFADQQTVFWEDYRYGNWDIFAGAVSPQGKLLWGEEGVPIVSLPLTQYAPQAIPWKDGSAIVVWEDYRGGKQYEIYLQKISSSGKVAFKDNGALVKTADGARLPKIQALPEDGSLVVVWEDYTGGGKAIFGQNFTIE